MGEILVMQEAYEGGENAEKSAWTPIEDNTVLVAELIEVKHVTKNFKDESGKNVEKMQFTFRVEDGEFVNRRVRGETSTFFTNHKNCKMRVWVEELLASEIPVGFRLDTDALVGLKARILVGKKVAPRLDGTGEWVDNFIKDVMRITPASQFETVRMPHALDPVAGEEPF